MFRTLITGTQPQPDTRIFIPDSPLPKGYRYQPRKESEAQRNGKGLKTVAFHAHPSDISGDFLPYIFLLENEREGAAFKPVILSMGEGTQAVKRPEFAGRDIVQVRIEEENAACDALGMPHPHYLQDANGRSFPNGQMMDHLPAIRDSIIKYIKEYQPERIVLPSPYPDHADHLAVYIAGMNAVLGLQKEGYFDERDKIEILACEPEFGVTKGRKVVLDKIPVQFGGNKEVSDESLGGMVFPHYRLEVPRKKGKIIPASEVSASKMGRHEQALARHTIAPAPYIVAIPEAMVAQKLEAMNAHKTQMKGTKYGQSIMLLDRLRGLEIGKDWGIGIYPVKIPEVTREDSPFLDNLNPATVFQLEKTRVVDRGR
jgi:LmbE family N-acetylglucosaminyl deacetylase